jgi:hypothetical protein
MFVNPSAVEGSLNVGLVYLRGDVKWLSDKGFPGPSVDLAYFDPPVDPKADYNVVFRQPRPISSTDSEFDCLRFARSRFAVHSCHA